MNMKKSIMKVALIAAALTMAGFAQADQSILTGSIAGAANVVGGSGGAMGQVQGNSGTNSLFGSTFNILQSSIDLDMSGWRANGFATAGGGSLAEISRGSATVNSTSYAAGGVSAQNGSGNATATSSVSGSAAFRFWH